MRWSERFGADTGAPVRAVRRAAGEGHGLDRCGRRRHLPVPGPRVPLRHAQCGRASGDGDAVPPIARCCASCTRRIKKVTEDFDNRWHFNTSIAALMELMNELYAEEAGLIGAALAQILRDADAAAGAVRALPGPGAVGRAGPHGSGVPAALAGVRSRAGEGRRGRSRGAGQRQAARPHVRAVRNAARKSWKRWRWPMPRCSRSSRASRW